MNYGFELMSEIIPLCIVAVLGIDMKKGGEKDFLPSIIILSIKFPISSHAGILISLTPPAIL